MERLFDSEPADETAVGERPEAPSASAPPLGGTAGHGRDTRPLAVRVRPRGLDEFVGQEHLLGEGSALRTAIEQGHPHSMILYGPPGSGKTTLARMVAERSQAAFEELSAVQAGRAEVRAVIERAAHRRSLARDGESSATVLFLDEIHRFNKAQQDALLPAVEEGLVTLIGATTENPAFEVNGALLSRVRVYALAQLSAEDVATVLRRAVAAREGADDDVTPDVDDDAIEFAAARSEGDARTALNALELASETARELGGRVTLARIEDALQRRAVLYDKKGDRHYDYASAWIKATRGSDPDASLYYLAVMLEGGEDPRFIVRRMIILASEDVGNADPQALSVATGAAAAVEHAGLPECQFALAPKSDAAGRALAAATEHVRDHGAAPAPPWLRSGPRPGQERGVYENPHRLPGHLGAQELLPEGVVGERFYSPDEAEAMFAERLREIERARGRERR